MKAIGVDEHIWREQDLLRGKAVTVMVDLTRGPDRRLCARLLDAFHVVTLAGNALDEVRRHVQLATLGRRGHKDDPLYRIRRTLRTRVEHCSANGSTASRDISDPDPDTAPPYSAVH